jgi:hypothetical protein
MLIACVLAMVGGPLEEALRAIRGGDLAAGIVQLRVLHEAEPRDASLARVLEEARGLVVYPSAAAEAVLRPARPAILEQALPPAVPYAVAAVAIALGTYALFAALTRRPRWAVPLAVACAAIAIACAAYGYTHAIHGDATGEVAAVQRATRLREGNGELYPELLALPVGVEVTVEHRRGAWCQVQIADGRRGWVPAADLRFLPAANAP